MDLECHIKSQSFSSNARTKAYLLSNLLTYVCACVYKCPVCGQRQPVGESVLLELFHEVIQKELGKYMLTASKSLNPCQMPANPD